MRAWPASSARLSGSYRCSSAHWRVAAVPLVEIPGTGCSMYCACPPSRHGGTTQARATWLATPLPWSLRTRCRHTSTPEAAPAEVSTSPSSTKSTSGSSAMSGNHSWKTCARAQCVVAGRPSSSPAAARVKAAVQIDTIRVPSRRDARAVATAGGTSRVMNEVSKGGITTVSAVVSACGPCSTVTEKSELVCTGRPSTVQVTTSYRPFAAPKTRLGMPSSNGYTPSSASTTTRCACPMAGSCRKMAIMPWYGTDCLAMLDV